MPGLTGHLYQHIDRFIQALHKILRLFHRVVRGETRAEHARHAEVVHQGFGAHLTGADGDAHLIQDEREVLMVRTFHGEGEDRGLLACSTRNTEETDARIARQRRQQILRYILLILNYFFILLENGVIVYTGSAVNDMDIYFFMFDLAYNTIAPEGNPYIKE